MQIQVKFFASLREQTGLSEQLLALSGPTSMSDVWQQVTDIEPPANLLCARNLQYVDWEDMVEDGDEIAFFPPVTGG